MPNPHESILTGWGRTPQVSATEKLDEDPYRGSQGVSLSRGMARSYGDSSLPCEGGTVFCSRLANRMLSFDSETGIIRVEAGLSLFDLNWAFLKRNWFTPVTPGTQFVTIGGMVASDVHGKNHHVAGCFGEHVTCLVIKTANDEIVECSREVHPDLFWATIGGMGLTGHILEVEFKMEKIPSPWIYGEAEQIPNLKDFIARLRDAADSFPMTVGWIDCLSQGRKLGRGILNRGRWAKAEEAPREPPQPKSQKPFPCDLPEWSLNHFSVKAFNQVYYSKELWRYRSGIEHPESFFYPLDGIRNWNRMYGKRGFTQFQCVIPAPNIYEPLVELLEILATSKLSSFLSVIKDCGPEGNGMLSFPLRGMSLALDIPMHPTETQKIVNQLNQVVIATKGRIYLTKDTLTLEEDFQKMESRLEAFNAVRRKWDPENRIKSLQSIRLLGDQA